GENFNNSTNGKSINGKSTSGKPNYIINTNILNTNVPNTNLSSSILQHFNNSICELRKTTTPKFLEYVNKYDEEFIFSIINYCEEVSIKSFAGFKKVIDSYIEKNILTKEEFIKDVETYRANKNKAKKTYSKKSYSKNNKVDSFNDYKQRDYDFDELEKLLNGESDKSLSECIKGNETNEPDGSSPVLSELKKLDLA
ncbi:hypothetical protein G8T71_10485, partial [Clostridium botulinum C/D]|nr:hypothetical protein [Clostridium botulinum C/D]